MKVQFNLALLVGLVFLACDNPSETESTTFSSEDIGLSSANTSSSSDEGFNEIQIPEIGIYVTDSVSDDTLNFDLSAHPIFIFHEITEDSIFRYIHNFTIEEVKNSDDPSVLLRNSESAFRMKLDNNNLVLNWVNGEARFGVNEPFFPVGLDSEFYFMPGYMIDITYNRVLNFRKIN